MSEQNEYPLISGKGFLESIRYQGLTTVDAVCELIDNSLDAHAKNIHVKVYSESGTISIAVIDDGYGISKADLPKSLSFGGRLTEQEQKNIGKFGFGLPSAATSQTKRTEIFSKQNGKWAFSYIDLSELEANNDKTGNTLPMLKSDEKIPTKELDLISKSDSGTIVILRKCDRHDPTSENRLITLLTKEIGRIYRHYIFGKRTITINEKELRPADPLTLMKNHQEAETLGYGELFGEDLVVINEIIDPETGKPAEIKIKVAYLDQLGIYERIGKNKVKPDDQGFYIVRNQREIASAYCQGLYSKDPHFTYFRGEIAFPSCLDNHFGVQTNKNRITIIHNVRDRIKQELAGTFAQVRRQANKNAKLVKRNKAKLSFD